MDNLKRQAFPHEADLSSDVCGLTKHEYTTIEIAKSLLSNPDYSGTHTLDIVDKAYDIAAHLLNKFK